MPKLTGARTMRLARGAVVVGWMTIFVVGGIGLASAVEVKGTKPLPSECDPKIKVMGKLHVIKGGSAKLEVKCGNAIIASCGPDAAPGACVTKKVAETKGKLSCVAVVTRGHPVTTAQCVDP